MKGQKGKLDLAQGHCEGKQIGSKSKAAKKLDFEWIENDGNRKLKRKSKELNTKMEGKRAKLRKEETVRASSCHDSLIFMSTHKAKAARCLSRHQATYGLPPSAWPL